MVEQPVGYLLTTLYYRRAFLCDTDLADQLTRQLAAVAIARVHGMTGEQPDVRFAREEQALLQQLVTRPYRSLVLSPATAAPSHSTRRYSRWSTHECVHASRPPAHAALRQ